MAVQTGIDIVKVSRVRDAVRKSGKRFLNRIFTPREIQICNQKASKYLSFAARFAAKEAFFKALQGKPSLEFKEVEIKTDRTGQPSISLASKVKKRLKLSSKKIALSLAHEKEFAIAIVIIS